MSGPSNQISKQRFGIDCMQKLGTTKLIFQDMNQLKKDCKELFFKRKVSLRCDTDKMDCMMGNRNRYSDVTRESNLEKKLSQNYTAPDSKSSELEAVNDDCTVLPEINQKHFKLNGRAAFKKVFSNKSLAKCKVLYKVVAKPVNPYMMKRFDIFEESYNKDSSPISIASTKSSILKEKIKAMYKKKSDLRPPQEIMIIRPSDNNQGNTQDFLEKLAINHNEIREEKIKLLKMASMRTIEKHPQELPISYKQKVVKVVNDCITFGSN